MDYDEPDEEYKYLIEECRVKRDPVTQIDQMSED